MSTLTLDTFEQHIQYWRLRELETVISEVEDAFADRVHKKLVLANDYKNILFPIMGKCITTLREIICLVMYGYPDGALSLARNLYEQFIIVAFLENHRSDSDFNEIVKDYFLNYKIEQYKALRYEANHCVQNSELFKAYTSRIEETKKLAHHKVSEKNDYWWSGKPGFVKLADDAQDNCTNLSDKRELAYLRLFYRRACASIHANCFGNSVRLGIDSGYNGVDTSPQSGGHGVALYLSAFSFLVIAGIAFDEFNLEFDNYQSRLNDLMSHYKKIVQKAYYSN